MIARTAGRKDQGLQQLLWSGCATALAVAGLATWGDRRRANRSDPDDVGFMPWPLVLVLAMIIAAVLAAFALKAG
jgi:hypothetical protein